MKKPSISNRPEESGSQIVSATELVRNFGTWQDRALTAPVYILKRGRPRLVLMASDLIHQIVDTPVDTDHLAVERDQVLNAMHEVVVLLDADQRLRFCNDAARSYFGFAGRDLSGMSLDRLLPPALTGFISDMVDRVTRGRLREHTEIAMPGEDERHLSLTLLPLRDGVALIGQDITLLTALAHAHGGLAAIDSALAVLEDVAKVQINLRGYLVRPTQSFAGLTRLPMETLATIRFVSVIDIAGRVAVADAIEQVLRTRQPLRTSARLLVNGADPRPISIGLSPIERGHALEGVRAILLAH